MGTEWTRAHLARLGELPSPRPIVAEDVVPLLPGYDLWDFWPLTREDGTPALVEEGTLWFVLSAPCLPDPSDRHDIARIRLLHRTATGWHDRGNALPDGMAPGSREWSGSALLLGQEVHLFFTAAGRRTDPVRTFEQRLFRLTGTLQEGPQVAWHGQPAEIVASDDDLYMRVDQAVGVPGHIKAFRDPAWFRDPADGSAYLLFAGSWKHTADPHNGVVGVARAADETLGRWILQPPLVSALGTNNELERPHIVLRDGRYYLFWSTQRQVFAPGVTAPTGLYGMVGDRFNGPYTPLNDSGLVLANPAAEPTQAYSWWVTPDGEATSFIDEWGTEGRPPAATPAERRTRFGGTWSPSVQLCFAADHVSPA